MGSDTSSQFVGTTLDHAIALRSTQPGLIVHSDPEEICFERLLLGLDNAWQVDPVDFQLEQKCSVLNVSIMARDRLDKAVVKADLGSEGMP